MLAFFISISIVSAPSTLFSEKIEAKVGTQIITSTDVHLVAEQLENRAQEPKTSTTLRKAALERLVEQALIKEYLASVQMEISEQDVDRRINSIRSAQGIESLEEFRRFIETQGLSFSAFRKQVRDQMEQAQFFQVLQRQTLQTISENELKAYYNANLSKFQHNYEVELQECLIPFGEERELIMKRAEYYRNNPNKFDECVSHYSRSASKAQKGIIGAFRAGSLREEVETLVFKLSKNQVGLVQLPGAVQLLKVISKRDLGPRSFEDVKDEIKQAVEMERIEKAREKLLSELRASTFIKIES